MLVAIKGTDEAIELLNGIRRIHAQIEVNGFAEVKDVTGNKYRVTKEGDDPNDIVAEKVRG